MFLRSSCLLYNRVHFTNDRKFIFDQKTKQNKNKGIEISNAKNKWSFNL